MFLYYRLICVNILTRELMIRNNMTAINYSYEIFVLLILTHNEINQNNQ